MFAAGSHFAICFASSHAWVFTSKGFCE